MNDLKHFAWILLFQFLLTGPLYAEINSWVDENGVRRYSDVPPDKPEGTVEVIEEIKDKEAPKAYQQKQDNWEEQADERKAEEEAISKENMLKKQKADREEKIKSAYEALNKLRDLVTGDVDWDQYERLLADAEQKIDALAGIPQENDARKQLLTEAYESYALVPELKQLETAGRTKSLIARIKEMNEAWGTEAPDNYFAARKICWQRAADKLDKSGITP